MVFIVLAIMVGLALGFISFYFQTLFLAGAAAAFGAFKTCFVLIILVGRPISRDVNASGRSEGWIMDAVNLYKAIYASLPDVAQLALLLCPVFLIVGRFLTWVHYAGFPEQALPRTPRERRHHTMQSFSLKKER